MLFRFTGTGDLLPATCQVHSSGTLVPHLSIRPSPSSVRPMTRVCMDPERYMATRGSLPPSLVFDRHQNFVEFENGFALLMNCGGTWKGRQDARCAAPYLLLPACRRGRVDVDAALQMVKVGLLDSSEAYRRNCTVVGFVIIPKKDQALPDSLLYRRFAPNRMGSFPMRREGLWRGYYPQDLFCVVIRSWSFSPRFWFALSPSVLRVNVFLDGLNVRRIKDRICYDLKYCRISTYIDMYLLVRLLVCLFRYPLHLFDPSWVVLLRFCFRWRVDFRGFVI